MQLTHVEISNFQSVRESNPLDVGDITCLVGSNEAGKTALLQALYRLNPVVPGDADYSVASDYPRADVDAYQDAVASGARAPAIVVRAMFALEESDVAALHEDFGDGALRRRHLILWKGYDNQRKFRIETDERSAVQHVLQRAALDEDIAASLAGCQSFAELHERLGEAPPTPAARRVGELAESVRATGFARHLYHKYLLAKVPRFVYFDEFYQLRGQENLETLKRRRDEQRLRPSDHPMLGLIEQAHLDIDQLLNLRRTQTLVNKLESAGRRLSQAVSRYWSQSAELRVRFDVRPAQPEDPVGMQEGTNLWAWVYDSRHMVTTGLNERSRGFMWFFSFMAWYSQLHRAGDSLILLLDEPGLSLHAQAQRDLLRYFEQELEADHQLIYTTHSPFMVQPGHLGRVRIVEDKGPPSAGVLESDRGGTRVLSEFMEASRASLIPLQASLGHEIAQSLLSRPNNLLVDDVSDLIYLKVMSELIQQERRFGLSPRWNIAPIGGSRRIIEFAALTGSTGRGTLAALLGIHGDERRIVDAIYARKLLQKNHIVTFGDFLGREEADLEDMFEPAFYLKLVSAAYQGRLEEPIAEHMLDAGEPCMRARVRRFFESRAVEESEPFDPCRPARMLLEHAHVFRPEVAHITREKFATIFLWLNSLL